MLKNQIHTDHISSGDLFYFRDFPDEILVVISVGRWWMSQENVKTYRVNYLHPTLGVQFKNSCDEFIVKIK